ncbi:MAG TPA: phosphoribosyl-ATP diphosphatase [Clostridiaceae bacterium]|nr:phosphoribosyl-ATP diphosphatase [Clostridiaceae bacterium]
MNQIGELLNELYGVIKDRQINPQEGAYTTYLFNKGIDKICKKVGEESTEVVIAAKNNVKDEVVYEISDLLYHLNVLMVEQDVNWDDIYAELKKRRT